MIELPMEIRSVDLSEGIVEGIVAPYDETTFLAGNGSGERIMRGAFRKSAKEQTGRLPLFRNHDHDLVIGKAQRISDRHPDGLWAQFKLGAGARYDEVRDELRQGLLTDLSVGMNVVQERKAVDGVREVTEAQLAEASLVTLGAYPGARITALRAAATVDIDYPHAPPAVEIPDWMLTTR